MITVSQTRQKGQRVHVQATLLFATPLEAAAHLANVELRFGGQIVEAEATRLKIETPIFNDLDTAVIEGPTEEMSLLLQLAYYHLLAGEKHQDLIFATAAAPEFESTLLFTLAAPMLVGVSRIKVAMLLACGITNEEDLVVGVKADLVDIAAAIQFAQEGVCSFREALA